MMPKNKDIIPKAKDIIPNIIESRIPLSGCFK